jgi:hypothetical protein
MPPHGDAPLRHLLHIPGLLRQVPIAFPDLR